MIVAQPPGVPEICKKSLTSCPASGGLELFVLGKNFLKDTKVYFQQSEDGHIRWEQVVTPDKEYLQQVNIFINRQYNSIILLEILIVFT